MRVDEGMFLWEHCYTCGHQLAYAASACPQCCEQFDGRPTPFKFPSLCTCARCLAALPPLMTRVTEGYALRRKSDGYLWVMDSDGSGPPDDEIMLSKSPELGSLHPDYWERVYVRRTVTIEQDTPPEGPTP